MAVCGLDADLWDDKDAAEHCRGLVKGEPHRDADDNVLSETLPFDTARAHRLYRALLGALEDLILGKQLLIVPSGALTQLPFQVLVTDLPNADASGPRTRKVGRLGAGLGAIPEGTREQLQLRPGWGVAVGRISPSSPAEAVSFQMGAGNSLPPPRRGAITRRSASRCRRPRSCCSREWRSETSPPLQSACATPP